jgi:Holliday junction resolvase
VDDLHDRETKSPKLKWLLGVLAEIRQRQEKAIVFVEFLDLQRQLQRYIQERFGYSPDIINGSTSAAASAVNSRQKRIRTFQNQTGFGVIILSPLAVGFGVNIQAANHVIHYTRTWSPAKEDQATDRAYRIGQTRDVTVYYPVITADFVTFDMKLDRLMDWKRGLSDDMLNGCGDLATSDFADLGAPEGGEVFADAPLDLHDIAQFDGKTFECLIAVVLAKQGYPLIYRTPDQGDAGVDVVAIRESKGLLVQCKTSLTSTSGLGWEAVKDVVAGTAFYELKHPGVSFTRIAATHHWFNQTAMGHAEINGVVLWDAETLKSLLSAYPITRFEVESLIAT